jgi:IclR family transcriptional regulator, mhp operon transcriptional activator
MHAKVEDAEIISDQSTRESTRPIRALNRGLQVLIELNRLRRAPINTLANSVDLPRTTTYRILETLRLAGYLERDVNDDCYLPTIMVRALSDGFDDQATLVQLAKPHLANLCTSIVWPITISTPSAGGMLVRETTDHQSPLALEHYSVGSRLPMLTSAAGRAYLAFCTPAERDASIELMSRSAQPEDRLAHDRPELDRMLNETRSQGYGVATRARRISEETSMAIPVRIGDRVIATMMVRFAATAVPLRTAEEQFLPKMRDVVDKLERAI